MKKLHAPDLIIENILFLDGLSRAGKFLLGNLLSNYEGIEFFQSVAVIEHLPILNYLELMEEDSLIALLKMYVNMHTYDEAIGRNINTRLGDASCIHNSMEANRYLKRSRNLNAAEVFEAFTQEHRIPSFLTHECLPHITFFLKAFPKSMMINIQRHPIDLACSWFKRGWGERWGTDPLAFAPVIRAKTQPIPWFANEWQDEYESMRPVDRVIKSICSLFQYEMRAYEQLEDAENKILLISFEQIMSDPHQVIKKIGDFLDSSPLPKMDEVLKKENCPRKIPIEQRQVKLRFLMDNCKDTKLLDELILLSHLYEKKWNIQSCNL